MHLTGPCRGTLPLLSSLHRTSCGFSDQAGPSPGLQCCAAGAVPVRILEHVASGHCCVAGDSEVVTPCWVCSGPDCWSEWENMAFCLCGVGFTGTNHCTPQGKGREGGNAMKQGTL